MLKFEFFKQFNAKDDKVKLFHLYKSVLVVKILVCSYEVLGSIFDGCMF